MLLAFVVLYLLGTLVIGYWASRQVRTTQDFALAGRRMPLIVAASALFATWFGSETIMGASSEFLERGLLGVIEDPFGAALCLILVGAFYARPLYRLNILTFNDFFRLRYDRRTEVLSAIFMVPSFFSWIAAQLVALAIVMHVLIGLPVPWGIWLCTFIVVVYTYIGGMWAVSITDFVQTIMIVIGLVAVAIQLLADAGGIYQVLGRTPEGFFHFFPHPTLEDVAHYIAAWITIGLGSIPGQDVFQRVMSARDEHTAVRASYLGGAMYLSIGMLPLLISLAGHQLYPELEQQSDMQMVLPQIVILHAGLLVQVLFFGALLSAVLSTTSGAILAPATVLAENIVRPLLKEVSDAHLLAIMRINVVGVAVASALMAMWQSDIYELVAQSSTLTLVSLFVPLTAGLYWQKASTTGALVSIIAGMTVWLACEVMGTTIPPMLYGLLASFAGILLGSWWHPTPSNQTKITHSG